MGNGVKTVCNRIANRILFEIAFFIFWLMFQRAKGDIRNLESVSLENLQRAVKVTKRNEYISGFFEAAIIREGGAK